MSNIYVVLMCECVKQLKKCIQPAYSTRLCKVIEITKNVTGSHLNNLALDSILYIRVIAFYLKTPIQKVFFKHSTPV